MYNMSTLYLRIVCMVRIQEDVGVTAVLQGRQFAAGTPEFGEAFETCLMHELKCFSDYISGEKLSYWRTTSGFEVDFIISDHTAVEVKAKKNLSPVDIKSLRKLAEERKLKRYICVSMEPRRRKIGNIDILSYQEFLALLWDGAYA
jgi:predicted AAA+ superfamily ATPase